MPVTRGPALLDVPWVRGLDFRWHPRDAIVTFTQLETSVTNLFGIPISGGDPKRLTSFQSGTFASYDWRSDGRLVLVRTQSSSDVVLISDWRGRR